MYKSTNPQSEPTFGEYLQALIDARPQWTTPKLAAALGVDASLVRRWLRNGRVPPFSSNYVERIAEFLRLTSAERRELEASQVTSQQARAHGTLAQRRNAESQGVADLLRTAARGISTQRPIHPWPDNSVALPTDGRPIRGARAVCEAANELLRRACELEIDQSEKPTIYTTYQGARSVTEAVSMSNNWHESMFVALQHGWNVCSLLRLEGTAERSFAIVGEMLAYLGATGNYEPFYFERHGALMPPYDLIVVPDVGCLMLFATESPYMVDAATYSDNPDVINMLIGHFQLLKAQTRSLFTLYEDGSVASTEAALELVQHPGDWFTIQNGPSVIVRPLSVYQDTANGPSHMKVIGEEPQVTAERATVGLSSIEALLCQHEHSFRDVCPKRAIEKLVLQGSLFLVDRYDSYPLPDSVRQEILENMINRLKDFPNYELALLDREEEVNLLGLGQDNTLREIWEVKRWYAIGLETWRYDNPAQQVRVDLVINEPTIVRAFWDYSEELWNRISPKNRAKDYVIWWLEQQLEKLRKQMGESVSK